MSTLNELVTLVAAELRDPGHVVWSADEIAMHLRAALHDWSRAVPRRLAAGLQVVVDARLEDAEIYPVTGFRLGAVERQIGIADQQVGTGSTLRIERGADAGRCADRASRELVRLGQSRDVVLRHLDTGHPIVMTDADLG